MKTIFRALTTATTLCSIILIFSGCGNDDDDDSYPEETASLSQPLVPANDAAYDDVFFKNYGTNPFIDTEDDHFSTFAMDVDTASYTVTRRFLNDGHLPNPDSVRTEEFINAFDYHYDPPIGSAFAVHIEGAPSLFGENEKMKLIQIGIQGRVVEATNRKDASLTFVIDVSGSMAMENRLELVKRALRLLVEELRFGDEVGIVVYGSRARVVLPYTGVEQRGEILAAIDSLDPTGSTFAEEGIRMGYDMALRNAKFGRINRVILCSDGVANVGKTGADAILREIRGHVQEGITLTTVGFGMGNFNDILMEQLANNGNGSYYYVDGINEARRVFVENLTGTLQLIAKDAKVQVDFNPQVVSRFRLLGYENRRLAHEQFRDDTVDGGEIGAGHRVTALYEIKLHEGGGGRLATVYIRYEDPDDHRITETSEDIFDTQLSRAFESASPEFQLACGVAEFAEILRESFWAQNGNLADVLQVIQGVSRRINSEQIWELERLINRAIGLKG